MKKYYALTKPGVLYGNVLTVVAGFLLAAGLGDNNFDFWLFVSTILGMTLVIASACVFNNHLDRDIDSRMERTKNRPTAAGEVSGRNAVIFGTVLGVVGISMLAVFVNNLVVAVGLLGFFVYVVLYGMLSKRLSVHGTLVGSVSGAAPILAGYVAVSGDLDLGAALVFLVLFFWQMPEFYSIAIYRRAEYKAAGVPVVTVVKGVENTKRQIFFYTLAFVIAALLLSVFDYTGVIYFLVMLLLGAYWLWLSAKGLRVKAVDNNSWARQMFRTSLLALLAFSLMISIDRFLP